MKSLILAICTLLISQGFAEKKVKINLDNSIYKPDVKEMNLDDFHKYHISEFVKAEGFGSKRVIIMPKIVHLIVDNKKYTMSNMRLLSVTDRKKPVMWHFPGSEKSGGIFLIDGLKTSYLKGGKMKKRDLKKDELLSLNKLKKGDKRVLSKSDDGIKLMAPLHGGPSCKRCHEDYKDGEFMGAFLYDLRSIDGGLNKTVEEKKPEIEKMKENQTKEITLLKR